MLCDGLGEFVTLCDRDDETELVALSDALRDGLVELVVQ